LDFEPTSARGIAIKAMEYQRHQTHTLKFSGKAIPPGTKGSKEPTKFGGTQGLED